MDSSDNAIFDGSSAINLWNKKKEEQKKEKKRTKPPKEKKMKTGNVYVQGLPESITKKEVVDYFAKCGVLKKDPETAEPLVKLYTDESGATKGDALVSYYRSESVELAVKILDGSEIRAGFIIKVQQATFAPKQGGKAQKPKKLNKKKMKLYDQSKELTWDEDETCHVIIKHLFDQQEAWKTPSFFAELEEEIRGECEKLGEVEKIKIFQRNPEGVAVIKFKDFQDAQSCIRVMNDRWFGGKQLQAELYDGWTNYQVDETDEQQEQRLRAFGQWLSDEE